MDNDLVFVEMIKSFGGKNANEKYEVEANVANELIENNLAKKVASPVDAAIEKFQKSIENRDEQLVEKLSASIKATNVKVPAVPVDHEEKSFGEWMGLVGRTACVKNAAMVEDAHNKLANKYGVQKTAMTQGTTTTGGFLVPQIWQKELLSVPPYEPAVFPNRCRIIPMETNVLNIPALDQTSTPSAGGTAFAGGVTIAIVSEGNAPANPTYPNFKSVQLVAKKLLAYTEVTSELLENSMLSIEAIVTEQFQRAVLGFVNYGCFQGNGTTNVTGVVSNAATVTVARKTAGSIDWTDLAKMYAALAPQSAKKACWYVNPLAMAKLNPINSPANIHWTYPDGIQNNPVMNFLGCPIVPTEQLPVTGQIGDVVLADMSYYVMGLNKNVTVEASPHVEFTSDKVVYRVVIRLDGKPQLTQPIVLADGSSQVSPFVQLGNVAS